MIVTEKEYQEMWKEFDGKTFTPLTNLIIEENEVDGVKVKIYKREILKTVDEVYQEWLDNKNNPSEKEPTETEILQKQLLETQNLVLELQYKLTNKDLEIK
ncbi:Uncharacterised protein [Clostridioides difficile]|nr:Uncharacterised protein [Clostridioides difficile]